MAKTSLAASLKQKKDIDLDELQQNVSQLHPQDKEEKEKSREAKKRTTKPEELHKFNVFLPKDLHKKIKVYCAMESINIKDFCSQAIIEKFNKVDGNK